MKKFITKHLKKVLVLSLFAIVTLAGLTITLVNRANAAIPTYLYQYISQTTNKDFASLVKGDTATVTLKVKNVGTATWRKTGTNPVHVGTAKSQDRISLFANSSWIGANRPTGLSADVLPGKTTTFTWTMTAPTTTGHYHEYFSLVAEGKTWMNNAGVFYSINVVPPRQLTVAAPPALTLSKPYDGTTSVATCTPGTLNGKVGSEVVTATCVATYANATVGTGKTINIVYTLAGADAAKYVKPVNGSDTTGIITTKQLTIGAPTVTLTKPYDGDTTVATCTPGTLSGIVGAEVVTATCVATYDTSAVGTDKTITIVYTLAGADAAKYVKPVNGSVATGIITAIVINVVAIPGVTAPVTGVVPVSTITETAQYTGTIIWTPVDATFVKETIYTAWITLTPKTGYTLTGVVENFFTVTGAAPVTNDANIGIVTAIFPVTVAVSKVALTAAITAEVGADHGAPIHVLTEANYTTATWNPYNAAIDAAIGTESAVNPTQAAVDAATGLIASTKAALVLVANLTNYNNALAAVSQADYTVGSWTTYQVVVTANVRTTQDTQGAVDTSTGLITAAQADLVFAGKADLDAAKATANGEVEASYTPASWDTFANIVTGERTQALLLVETTNANVVAKTAALNDAISHLVLKTPLESIAAITGTVQVGQTLTAGARTPGGATVTYQWRIADSSDGTYADIGGATAINYTLLTTNVGKFIKVVATATGDYSGTATSAATIAVAATPVTIAVVPGVTAPVTGVAPVSSVTATDEYTGTITWSDSPVTFAENTVYTAWITLTPKTGYTCTGVAANFFTVAGAAPVTNAINTCVVTAIFPVTATTITIAVIPGVTAPVTHATPVTTTTETAQYTGTVAWSTTPTRFAAETVYTATITLTAKAGFTLSGVAENLFTVAGTTPTNSANSGVVTAVFPTTAEKEQLTIAAPALFTKTKEYDGGTTAAFTAGALIGVNPLDTVTVTGVATYDTSAVGAGKTITVVYTLGGAQAANYVKPVNNVSADNEITTKQLTIAAPALFTKTKEYDGGTTAAFTAGALIGIVGIEDVTVSGVATYDTSAVGAGKTITVVYTLGGAQAANYVKPVNNVSADNVITVNVINVAAIAGVTVPVTGEAPDMTVTSGTGYTATVEWLPVAANFAALTEYTAYITLTPTTGYTLTGVAANFFTVAGSESDTNAPNSGIVTAVFPDTL